VTPHCGRRSWAKALLITSLLALACASSEDLTRRERGDRAFEKGDYPQAIQEYQVYLEEGMASADAMEAQFMLARSYFENEDYPTAAVEFEIFQRDYPRSDSLEAAAFYEARCWVEQSPPYDRDATLTEKAIRMLENFLLDYPASEYAEPARAEIGVLRDKLARKWLETARLYRGLRRQEAEIIYYEKLLREHPDSAYWDEGILELLELRMDRGEETEARRLLDSIIAERADAELESRARALIERRR